MSCQKNFKRSLNANGALVAWRSNLYQRKWCVGSNEWVNVGGASTLKVHEVCLVDYFNRYWMLFFNGFWANTGANDLSDYDLLLLEFTNLVTKEVERQRYTQLH